MLEYANLNQESAMKTSVSLGENVWVKLNARGMQALTIAIIDHQGNMRSLGIKKSVAELAEGFPKPDADGWYEINFMELMKWYGPYLLHGETPFVGNEVHFVDPRKKK